MPTIYLSPSTQENNLYVNGGTEEEWMNRLADAMVPLSGVLRHPICPKHARHDCCQLDPRLQPRPL